MSARRVCLVLALTALTASLPSLVDRALQLGPWLTVEVVRLAARADLGPAPPSSPPPATEATVLEDPDRIRRDRVGKARAIVLRNAPESLADPELVARRIVELSEIYGFEPELVLALVHTESSFRPTVRSRAGAVGLMQILPATGRELALELEVPWRGAETLHDPEINLWMGIHYLARLREDFDGDMDLAISAYNLGPARVKRYVRDGRRPHWYRNKVERHRRRFLEWSPHIAEERVPESV